ncbi:c-type cytochrome [Flavisphingomonas formosensis]|uniref:c-type cytochrome n=1 Tax=Flavisphingomonas formosensis TaxID=861534 RepID=UPI0012FC8975|nr:hypothetical protein [Sphingomonas formosensis]
MYRKAIKLGVGLAPIGLSVLLSAAAPDMPPARSPRVNYALNCQGCHLPDGSGMPGKVPNMRGRLADFLRVEGGREYIVQVPGAANSKLSDADTARLMNWLVQEMGPSLPADFRPYSTREVADLRAHWLRNPADIRTRLIARIDALPKTP